MKLRMRVRDRLLWGLVVGGGILSNVIESGSHAYHTDKLYYWTPVGYSKKKYRDLLGRLYREGYIQRVLIERQVHYRITGSGRRKLAGLYPILKMGSQKWDGFWRVVIFDVPESKRRSRDALRERLKKQGFAMLQSSVYISTYDYGKEFLDFLQAKGLMGKALILESKQKHLGNPRDLANKVWRLEEINSEYREVIDRLSTRFGVKGIEKRKEFLKRVYQDYLKILIKDPFLPEELLPNEWLAGKALKFVVRAGVIKG